METRVACELNDYFLPWLPPLLQRDEHSVVFGVTCEMIYTRTVVSHFLQSVSLEDQLAEAACFMPASGPQGFLFTVCG